MLRRRQKTEEEFDDRIMTIDFDGRDRKKRKGTREETNKY